MPKYLIQASYTVAGTKGLLKDGGTKRRTAVNLLMKQLGGSLEAFYFGFGNDDVYAIVDAPDNVTVAAVALTITASGAVKLKTTVLLSPDEIDQAAKKSVPYRAPGQ